MALDSFTGLKAEVASWLHRDDLTAQIPTFIGLAESRFRRDLRVRQQITTTTLTATPGSPAVTLPTDWLAFDRLRLSAPDRALEYVTPEQWAAKYRLSDSGTPDVYTIEGASLKLGPTPDAAYELEAVYHAQPAALSDSNTTNWLLTQHPALYLWATLAEAAPFTEDDNRSITWEGKYAKTLSELIAADWRDTTSGATLRIRPR